MLVWKGRKEVAIGPFIEKKNDIRSGVVFDEYKFLTWKLISDDDNSSMSLTKNNVLIELFDSYEFDQKL